MTDEVLQQTAVSVVDDLYKFAFGATSIGSVHCAYVGAVCQPLTDELTARGFAVHYIAVVPPTDRETIAADRLKGFRALYLSSGLIYLCPLGFALDLIAADGARIPAPRPQPRNTWPKRGCYASRPRRSLVGRTRTSCCTGPAATGPPSVLTS